MEPTVWSSNISICDKVRYGGAKKRIGERIMIMRVRWRREVVREMERIENKS
jgi:hypothetical protein